MWLTLTLTLLAAWLAAAAVRAHEPLLREDFAETAWVAATACATTCQERNCGSSGQRYGKYCGIGHTGCSGEAPCDAVDACCREHDLCVSGLAVILTNDCHDQMHRCLDVAERQPGFSDVCPLEDVLSVLRRRWYDGLNLEGFLRAFRALLRERTTVRMQQSAAALSLEPTRSSGSSSGSSSSTGGNSSGASNC